MAAASSRASVKAGRSRSVWVRFDAPFDFYPPEAPTSFVAYRAGWSGRVPGACWDQAQAKGAAVVKIKAPSSRAAANAVRDGEAA